MKQRVLKLSLFSKAILVLIFTIVGTAVLSFGYMYGEMRKVVTQQIRQGTGDTLNLANVRLQERMVGGISLLIALRTDEDIQAALVLKPETAAERIAIAKQIRAVIRNAYYAVDTLYKVAVISSHGDVYANWEMVDTGAVTDLGERYYHAMETVSFPQNSTLYTQVVRNIEISTTGAGVGNFYVQYMPLVGSGGEPQGVAMVILSETELYDRIRFSQEEIHNVFLLGQNHIILSAQDKDTIGVSFDALVAKEDIAPSRILYSPPAPRTELLLVDIMSEAYIEQQVWLIMQRMIVYTLLSISGITIAAYFLMHGITRPLKRLTKHMISSDYASFVHESADAAGKNEILLLERGFAEMDEDIRSLLAGNEQKEKQKRDIEIAALQSQIQPHFLFNTLNTVRCAILNKHDEKAAGLIVNLIALLRMTIVNGDELVTLRQELETVGHYLDIIKLRHTTQFSFSVELSEDTASLRVPKLLLQPLVENCVIHGFAGMKQGGSIVVSSRREGGEWCIAVCNNGAPLAREIDLRSEPVVTRDSFSGIGIQNVNRRVKLYYGEAAGLHVYTDEDGLTVSELRMPWSDTTVHTEETR